MNTKSTPAEKASSNVPKPRQTRQRAVVQAALASADTFLSAQQLHAMLRDAGEKIGLATVYRTLQSLAELHQADKIFTPEGEVHYRKCSRVHHHHLICRTCGLTVEIDDGPIASWVSTTASVHDFHDLIHEVEIYGSCASCWSKLS